MNDRDWWQYVDEDDRWIQKLMEDEERQERQEIDKAFKENFKRVFGVEFDDAD